MKLLNLIKSIPFISTLIVIIFLNINNQKEYTKLKILIWTTPTLSLGNYLAISAGTGYLLSYIVTSSQVKNNKKTVNETIKYKFNTEDKDSNFNTHFNRQLNKEKNSHNTLIERDIKDPSPTINATFRVIGNTNINNQTLNNNESQDEYISDSYAESDHEYYNQENKYKNNNNIDSILNDWEDDTYLNW
tara:strand:+ start:507 stop:1073 length:567 start_codon:yes stop_codon:yes gene_type:complete